MDDDGKRKATTIAGILEKLAQTSYAELIHDDELRRHELFKVMAESGDPVVREMGQQLRDGLITPVQMLTVPEYAEVLQRGYERLQEVDMEALATEIDELREQEMGDDTNGARGRGPDPGQRVDRR